jgi:hypothetical protein
MSSQAGATAVGSLGAVALGLVPMIESAVAIGLAYGRSPPARGPPRGPIANLAHVSAGRSNQVPGDSRMAPGGVEPPHADSKVVQEAARNGKCLQRKTFHTATRRSELQESETSLYARPYAWHVRQALVARGSGSRISRRSSSCAPRRPRRRRPGFHQPLRRALAWPGRGGSEHAAQALDRVGREAVIRPGSAPFGFD